MMRIAISLLIAGALSVGCSDSPSTTLGGSGGSTTQTGGSGGSGGGTGGTGGSTTTTSSSSSTGGSPVTIDVVINEVQATLEDYVELTNTGTAAFDLGGYGLADSDSNGQPKLLTAVLFPAGTTLAPGDHLLVVAEQDPAAGVGPHDVCLTMSPVSSCFYATWGISAANGEKLFLLAPDNSIVGQAEYPINAAPSGSSWGRIPDGTGPFQVTAQTPGAANSP
ncbi:MAG: lamin tail domain-containing protein [Polyangiaceae bacterium]|nr:lamin tail domain-containing protein [Polyangiaceae bacterium]